MMEIIKDLTHPLPPNCALCLGYFDGLHRGHFAVIKAARKAAAHVALLTFDRSPKSFLAHQETRVLCDTRTRDQLLKEAGVDYLIVQTFDETFASMSAEAFCAYLRQLSPSILVMGEDFTFGKHAQGKPSLLASIFPVCIISECRDTYGKFSSSRIIKDLLEGNFEDVSHVLGRNYLTSGKVIRGFGRGRQIDFPTANLLLSTSYFLPKNGVYGGWLKCGYERYPAMINCGIHPTIDALSTPLVEVHLINYEGDLYDQEVTVEWAFFHRDEQPFPSLLALRDQLLWDRQTILQRLIANDPS